MYPLIHVSLCTKYYLLVDLYSDFFLSVGLQVPLIDTYNEFIMLLTETAFKISELFNCHVN